MAIDWSRSYSADLRVYRVDRRTWADAERVAGVASASIVRSANGDAPVLESGTFAYDGAPGEAFGEEYHRVVMVVEQGGERERVELCTMLCRSSGYEARRGGAVLSVEGAGVLWPASRTRLLAGTYAPEGADGAEFAAGLLRGCVHAPVTVEGGFALGSHVVFDLGATALEAAWQVLGAGGYCMQVTGGGEVRVMPMPSEPSLVLGGRSLALLSDGIGAERDVSEVPNRYTAIDGTQVATAVNDDPSSEVSTVARGYFADVVDERPLRVGGETLQAYAERRLAEESVAREVRTYKREYQPGALPFGIVRAAAPSLGMEGDYRIVSQSISVGRGASVSETVAREEALWTP